MRPAPSFVSTIVAIHRQANSVVGNPTWLIAFANGRMLRTETNGAVGYEVSNFANAGQPVDVWLTSRGQVYRLATSQETTHREGNGNDD